MRFNFIRPFSRKAALPAVCQTLSGSESQRGVPRGAAQAGQKGRDGSEEAASQDKVQRMDEVGLY